MENLKPDEILRICNKCNTKWYSSISREKELNAKTGGNTLLKTLDIVAFDFNTASQRTRNIDALEQELNKIKRCPNCSSYEYKEYTQNGQKTSETIIFDHTRSTVGVIGCGVALLIYLIIFVALKIDLNFLNFALVTIVAIILLISNETYYNNNYQDKQITLMEKIRDNKIDEVKDILDNNNININLEKVGHSGFNDKLECIAPRFYTPLVLSIYNELFDMTTFLIEKGADINLFTSSNINPILVAVIKNNNSLVNLLIKNNVNINYVISEQKYTPLIMAIITQSIDIVWTLLENGADINFVSTTNGYSPIHYAIEVNNITIVRLLLEKNADISIKDLTGKTPLSLAIFKANKDIIELLRSAESKKTDIQNKEGINKLNNINSNEIECPFCAEIIKKKAKICRFCNKSLESL